MNERWGRKFTEIKDWLEERKRARWTFSRQLVYCYVRAECTHTDYLRSVGLITWGAISLFVLVCGVCVGVGMRVWAYSGDTSQLHVTHPDLNSHIVPMAYMKSIVLSAQMALIIHPGCKVALGVSHEATAALASGYTSTAYNRPNSMYLHNLCVIKYE